MIEILYEDANMVAVAKPAGIVVNTTNTHHEPTVQDWWRERLTSQGVGSSQFEETRAQWGQLIPADWPSEYGTPEEVFVERGGVAHRLDKETSGVLLLAKNPGSLANLLAQFRLRQTKKTYLCLVHGKFQILSDTLSFPLSRSPSSSRAERMRFQVVADGRPAETTYRVLNFYPLIDSKRLIDQLKSDSIKVPYIAQYLEQRYQGFSLVECQPKTGRTHQIRVHLAHVRHPLVSDPLYLGTKRISLDQLWCPRLFLHAVKLEWSDPQTGEARQVSSPLPPDLQRAQSFLLDANEAA